MSIDKTGRDRTRATARLTGLAYLGLLVFGPLGFMVIRGRLYVSNDAAETAANLIEREGLARLGIAADLVTALAQAVTAVLFILLFRRVHAFAAASITAFGLMSAAVLLFAAACSATALEVALDGTATSADDALLLYRLQGSAWEVGGLFFGLWLFPMGWLVLRSAYMPRPIGWLLLLGGAGYLLSTFVNYLLPDATGLADALVAPSTIGELWMIGYLLVKGVSNATSRPTSQSVESTHRVTRNCEACWFDRRVVAGWTARRPATELRGDPDGEQSTSTRRPPIRRSPRSLPASATTRPGSCPTSTRHHPREPQDRDWATPTRRLIWVRQPVGDRCAS